VEQQQQQQLFKSAECPAHEDVFPAVFSGRAAARRTCLAAARTENTDAARPTKTLGAHNNQENSLCCFGATIE